MADEEEKRSETFNRTAAAVLLAALIGPAIWLGWNAWGQVERENLEAVKRLLHDPYSAQFSELKTTGKTTCGLVNAKNLMGAYTGNELFIATSGTAYIGNDAMGREDDLFDVCTHEAQMVGIKGLSKGLL